MAASSALKTHKHYNCNHDFQGAAMARGFLTHGPFPANGTDETAQPPLTGEMRANDTKVVRWTGTAWVEIAFSAWS